MISARRLRRPSAPWLRVLAAVCAGMVLLLSAASVSPSLHAWIHGETSDHAAAHVCEHTHAGAAHDDDDGPSDTADTRKHAHECAITLFSHGVTPASILVATLDRLSVASDAVPSTRTCVALPEPRHLRPQPQAPPVA